MLALAYRLEIAQQLITALFSFVGCGEAYGHADLLSLVHLSNQFRVIGNAEHSTLRVGDAVSVEARLIGVWDEANLRTITVRAIISKLSRSGESQQLKAEPAVEVESAFAIRAGAFQTKTQTSQLLHGAKPESPAAALFQEKTSEWQLALTDQKVLSVLASKKWHSVDASKLVVGHTLAVVVTARQTPVLASTSLSVSESSDDPASAARSCFMTTGTISDVQTGAVLGTIECAQPATTACVVLGYLQRHAVLLERDERVFDPPQHYPTSQWTAPLSNQMYALASKDVNPIHTSGAVAALAGLPTTITHGMFTSCVGRQLIQGTLARTPQNYSVLIQLCWPVFVAAAAGLGGTVTRWRASFVGMVIPGSKANAEITLRSVFFDLNRVCSSTSEHSHSFLVQIMQARCKSDPPSAQARRNRGCVDAGHG